MGQLLRAVLTQVEASQNLSVAIEGERLLSKESSCEAPLTPTAFIDHLATLGVRLTPNPDGTLGCRAPQGTLTPELQAQLAHYKADLLALLRPEWPGTVGCARDGGHNFMKQRNPCAREEVQMRCARCNALEVGTDT